MELDYLDIEQWNVLNERLSDLLGHQKPISTQFLLGVGPGLVEVAMSLSHFFSHKKSVAFVNDQSPFIKLVIPGFYKQMYQVQQVNSEVFRDCKAWVDSLPQDTLFVIYAEDHPITGQKFDWDSMDLLLNARKIFSIRISHQAHFFVSTAPRPYSIRICSYLKNGTIAVLGDKYKAPPLFSHSIAINHREILKQIEGTRMTQVEDRELVLKFESEISDLADSFFQADVERYYDRSVLVFSRINAEALISEIQRNRPEFGSGLFTTSLCYFESFNTEIFKGSFGSIEDPNILRGLIVISIDLLKKNDFIAILRASYQEVLRLQDWD